MKTNKTIAISCSILFLFGIVCLMITCFLHLAKSPYELEEYPYTLDTGFTFTAVRVTGMWNKTLEKKINDSLKSYFFILEEPYWFEKTHVTEKPYIIHCRTDRYLSVEYQFYNHRSDTRDTEVFHHCVTVDMKTGEVICLDDLVRVDESFAEFVKHGNILHCPGSFQMDWTPEEASENLNKWYSRYDTDIIVLLFELYTSKYLYDDYNRETRPNYWEQFGSKSLSLYTRNYFYIEEGTIYMQEGGFHDDVMWIETKDIEDYLLVPVW